MIGGSLSDSQSDSLWAEGVSSRWRGPRGRGPVQQRNRSDIEFAVLASDLGSAAYVEASSLRSCDNAFTRRVSHRSKPKASIHRYPLPVALSPILRQQLQGHDPRCYRTRDHLGLCWSPFPRYGAEDT
jgi:hypothetical protein